MAWETLEYEARDGIATITVSRPKALNALTRTTLRELVEAAETVRHDDDARVAILTGAGDKAFVAGADIAEMRDLGRQEAEDFARLGQRATRELETMPKPVIAAVNGFALGGGCELALGCDFIFASDRAKFGQPEVGLGLTPGFGGTQRLARLLGPARARQLVYTSETVDAQRAREMGLVNEVLQPEGLMERTREVASTIASKGPLAVGATKRALNRGHDLALDAGLEVEAMFFGSMFDTEDVREGTSAFLEKRSPDFRGR